MRANPTVPREREEPDARHDPCAETIPGLPIDDSLDEAPTRPLRRPRWWRARAWWARLRPHLPFLAILAVAFYLITINVASPWQSMHEDNGTLNESIAVNHLRYGLGVTKGQDLLDEEARQSFGPQHVTEAQHFAYFRYGPVHPQVYGDHPPLLGLTIAASFIIFGFHFWAERLVPIVYSLLGLLLFYRLVYWVFDIGVARLAAFLYATFPMLAYFGRNVSHEAAVMFWALLLLTGYVRWCRQPTRGALAQMALAVVIGGLYGWPMFYFAPILCIVDAIAARRIARPLALVTVLPAALTFALVMAQLDWVMGGNLSRLSAMFAYRTGGGQHGVAVTTIAWLHQLTVWNAEGFGAWSQAALPLAAFFAAARAGVEGWSLRLRLLVIPAVWGISHVLIFRNGALIHAYWQFYLLPVYALALAWAAVTLARRHITSAPLRALALVFAAFVALNLNLAPILSLYSTGYHVTLPVVPLVDLWR
jgi:4-amino-4-deoxy-L-arabinose transferase-like glycosyltransferase